MRLEALGERDGWRCWLCGQPVDRDGPRSSPWAPTVDHVVPRSRGGRTEDGNLRLAHRRCNGQRSNHLPELTWPDDLGLLDRPSLWQSIARLVRRPGRSEVVALAPTVEAAEQAGAWAAARAEAFVGGTWTVELALTGVAEHHVVRLRVDGSPADPGRPVTDRPTQRSRSRPRRR